MINSIKVTHVKNKAFTNMTEYQTPTQTVQIQFKKSKSTPNFA